MALKNCEYGADFDRYNKDFYESEGLLHMNGKLNIVFALKNAMMNFVSENHIEPGMKFLAEYIRLPHIH